MPELLPAELREAIDQPHTEAELRPLVISYLGILLDADISRPHQGLYRLPGGILCAYDYCERAASGSEPEGQPSAASQCEDTVAASEHVPYSPGIDDPRHVHNSQGLAYDPRQEAFESRPSPYEHTVAPSISNEFLDRYLALIPEPARSQIGYCLSSDEWDAYNCDTCGRLVHRPVSSCKGHYCPTCAVWYALRKAMQTYDRLRPFYRIDGSEKRGSFIKVIFNIPAERWPEIEDHASMDRLVAAAVIAARKFVLGAARGDLRRRGFKLNSPISLGFLAFIHTWDEDLTWRPHVEVIFPNLVLMGNQGRPMRFKFHRSENELKFLKAYLWPKILKEHFGWKHATVDVHYGFFSSEAQVVHRLKYGIRPPIPEDPNPDPELMLMHFKFREGYRVQRWYGFLSTRHVKAARSAVRPASHEATDELTDDTGDTKSFQSGRIPCPDPSCPGFLVFLGRFSTSELLKLYRDRGLDPPRALSWVARIRSPELKASPLKG